MRILMVNKFLYPNGGSESYIFKLGDYFKMNGHEVEYFGMEHKDRIVSNSANAYTSNMDFHSSKFAKILYPFKVIYSMEARKKIREVLEVFKPDVVHLNNFNFQLTTSIIVEIRKYEKETSRKVKIIMTAHDYQLVCPNHMMNNPITRQNCEKCANGKFLNCTKQKCIHCSLIRSFLGTLEGYYWNKRKIYKNFDSIICPSNFLAEKLAINPMFQGKTIVLHNFIDDIRFELSEKKDYVLYFGRFSTEKGIENLVEVCKSLPQVSFVFAGTGPLSHLLEGIPNIKNMGFQNGKDLEKLIREARFSVYTSEWYENCPFSVMESQMYGTPVLGANIGGIPELIEEGKTGELFESGNKKELREKILKLWENKSYTDIYSQNCETVSFDKISDYANKLMKIYLA